MTGWNVHGVDHELRPLHGTNGNHDIGSSIPRAKSILQKIEKNLSKVEKISSNKYFHVDQGAPYDDFSANRGLKHNEGSFKPASNDSLRRRSPLQPVTYTANSGYDNDMNFLEMNNPEISDGSDQDAYSFDSAHRRNKFMMLPDEFDELSALKAKIAEQRQPTISRIHHRDSDPVLHSKATTIPKTKSVTDYHPAKVRKIASVKHQPVYKGFSEVTSLTSVAPFSDKATQRRASAKSTRHSERRKVGRIVATKKHAEEISNVNSWRLLAKKKIIEELGPKSTTSYTVKTADASLPDTSSSLTSNDKLGDSSLDKSRQSSVADSVSRTPSPSDAESLDKELVQDGEDVSNATELSKQSQCSQDFSDDSSKAHDASDEKDLSGKVEPKKKLFRFQAKTSIPKNELPRKRGYDAKVTKGYLDKQKEERKKKEEELKDDLDKQREERKKREEIKGYMDKQREERKKKEELARKVQNEKEKMRQEKLNQLYSKQKQVAGMPLRKLLPGLAKRKEGKFIQESNSDKENQLESDSILAGPRESHERNHSDSFKGSQDDDQSEFTDLLDAPSAASTDGKSKDVHDEFSKTKDSGLGSTVKHAAQNILDVAGLSVDDIITQFSQKAADIGRLGVPGSASFSVPPDLTPSLREDIQQRAGRIQALESTARSLEKKMLMEKIRLANTSELIAPRPTSFTVEGTYKFSQVVEQDDFVANTPLTSHHVLSRIVPPYEAPTGDLPSQIGASNLSVSSGRGASKQHPSITAHRKTVESDLYSIFNVYSRKKQEQEEQLKRDEEVAREKVERQKKEVARHNDQIARLESERLLEQKREEELLRMEIKRQENWDIREKELIKQLSEDSASEGARSAVRDHTISSAHGSMSRSSHQTTLLSSGTSSLESVNPLTEESTSRTKTDTNQDYSSPTSFATSVSIETVTSEDVESSLNLGTRHRLAGSAELLKNPSVSGRARSSVTSAASSQRSASKNKGDHRFSPASLSFQITNELNVLDGLDQSLHQLGGVERSRAVALAQQETVALAQFLKSRQLDTDEEVRRIQAQQQKEHLDATTKKVQEMQRQLQSIMEQRRGELKSKSSSFSTQNTYSSNSITNGSYERVPSRSFSLSSQSMSQLPSRSNSSSNIAMASSLTKSRQSSVSSSISEESAVSKSSQSTTISDDIEGFKDYSPDFEVSVIEEDLDKSLMSVVPSEGQRKRLKREGSQTDLGSVSMSTEDLHSSMNSRRMSFEEDSFQRFSLEMVRQYMQEEEIRAQHQAMLLKLREKALKDKLRAELAWIEKQKRSKVKGKGGDDAYPQLGHKKKFLLSRLKHEQAEIKRLQEAQKNASKERKFLLMQSQQLETMQLATRKKKQILKNEHEDDSKSVASDVPTEEDVSHMEEASDLSTTIMSDIDESKCPPSLKKFQIDEKHLTVREKELRRRRKTAEDLMAWKLKLDAEENEVKKMERQFLSSWKKHQGSADKKKDAVAAPASTQSEDTTPRTARSELSIPTESSATSTSQKSENSTVISESIPSNRSSHVDSDITIIRTGRSEDICASVVHSSSGTFDEESSEHSDKLHQHESDDETSVSIQSEVQIDQQEVEMRIKKLRAELNRRKAEVEKLRRQQKNARLHSLREEENELLKQIGQFDNIIEVVKSELVEAKLKSVANPEQDIDEDSSWKRLDDKEEEDQNSLLRLNLKETDETNAAERISAQDSARSVGTDLNSILTKNESIMDSARSNYTMDFSSENSSARSLSSVTSSTSSQTEGGKSLRQSGSESSTRSVSESIEEELANTVEAKGLDSKSYDASDKTVYPAGKDELSDTFSEKNLLQEEEKPVSLSSQSQLEDKKSTSLHSPSLSEIRKLSSSSSSSTSSLSSSSSLSSKTSTESSRTPSNLLKSSMHSASQKPLDSGDDDSDRSEKSIATEEDISDKILPADDEDISKLDELESDDGCVQDASTGEQEVRASQVDTSVPDTVTAPIVKDSVAEEANKDDMVEKITDQLSNLLLKPTESKPASSNLLEDALSTMISIRSPEKSSSVPPAATRESLIVEEFPPLRPASPLVFDSPILIKETASLDELYDDIGSMSNDDWFDEDLGLGTADQPALAHLKAQPELQETYFLVPHQVDEVTSLLSKAVDDFWDKRRCGESWDDLSPPTEFLGKDGSLSARDGDMETTSRVAYKTLVYHLSGEMLRCMYEGENEEEQPPYAKPSRLKSKAFYRGSKPPTTLDKVHPIVEKNVLEVMQLTKPETIKSKILCSRKRKDAVDLILAQELFQEESEWTDYDGDELTVKLQLSDHIFNDLICDTVQALQSALSTR